MPVPQRYLMATTPLHVRIGPTEAEHLEKLAESTSGILTKAGVVRLLIQQAMESGWNPLDKAGMLGGPSEAGTPLLLSSSYSSSSKSISKEQEYKVRNENKNATKTRAKTRAKRTQGTPEFEAFWKVYQSCPSKANCQSKAAAWEAWEQVIAWEAPQRLLEAAQKAVDQCHDLQRRGEFCAPLPDCFRWLRDERYAVLLEDHAPAAPAKPSWML